MALEFGIGIGLERETLGFRVKDAVELRFREIRSGHLASFVSNELPLVLEALSVTQLKQEHPGYYRDSRSVRVKPMHSSASAASAAEQATGLTSAVTSAMSAPPVRPP